MRLKCIACEVLARAVYLGAARSPHIVDIELLPKGLHLQPANLRARLQEAIDTAAQQGYDAVLLGYGLCGMATAGLKAGAAPLVLPRAHDCITLFLGSRDRYAAQFDSAPGTYWYAHDYVERDASSGPLLSLGSLVDADLEAVYEGYVAKFGKDNADYLMEVMGAWQKHYQRAVYIETGLGDGSATRARAQAQAERRQWLFETLAGDLSLVYRLLNGEWGDDFLQVPAGGAVTATLDEGIIGCSLLS